MKQPSGFFQNSVKFLCSFLLINFAVKLLVLNLLIYKLMNNGRVCKSRKKIRESPHKVSDTIFYKTGHILRKVK